MKEAIERMDSGLLFAVGRPATQHGRDQFEANRPRFLEHLKVEQAQHHAARESRSSPMRWSASSASTSASADRFFALPAEPPDATGRGLLPASCCRPSSEIRKSADQVLSSNQENMTAMDRRARDNAATSIRLMIVRADRRGRPGGRSLRSG